jgi:phage tail sheath protein FI
MVAAALEAKAELVGDLTNAIAIVDIESKETKKIEDVKEAKNKLGCFTRWTVLCWPKVLMGGVEIYASAAVAALLQYVTVNNAGVPTSPDNKTIPIDGVVIEGGKELHLTKKQVNNYLNAVGVLSFTYFGGWKCWGNNTSAYPDNTDPNNRFIKCVMVSSYLENRFKTEYLSTVGEDGSYKVIGSVVSNYNADLNALTPNYLAGAAIVFDKNENPMANILDGHYKFHTRYADYTPLEYIENEFTWDSQILQDALEGGEE